MKRIFTLALIFILSIFTVLAHGEETFARAEEIIESKIPCNELTNDQLEDLGDYYMEQMHPGEQHEIMDQMMGGEGSESLKQTHINMALAFYCGEHNAMSLGMMNMMMGRGNMMGFGLQSKGGMINMMDGYGMMGGTGFWSMSFFWLLYVAIAAFIFGIIFWLTYKLIIKNKGR